MPKTIEELSAEINQVQEDLDGAKAYYSSEEVRGIVADWTSSMRSGINWSQKPKAMPALNKTIEPEAYLQAVKVATDLGHKGFCGPLAMAMLTGMPMGECLALCEKHGRKPTKGMRTFQLRKAFQEAGFEITEIESSNFISKYPGVHKNLQQVTSHHPRRFPLAFKGWDRLLVVTKDHYLAIVDGATLCYSVNRSMRAVQIFSVKPNQQP